MNNLAYRAKNVYKIKNIFKYIKLKEKLRKEG